MYELCGDAHAKLWKWNHHIPHFGLANRWSDGGREPGNQTQPVIII